MTITPAPSLLAALRHLLRPLVRLLVAHGVTYAALGELLKQLYVEVADREFRLDGRANTDSRISLLSGVHRKEVRRLRAPPPSDTQAMPEAVAFGARLVAAWTTQREYRDSRGRPRRLARLARRGGERSFESLVASLSKDIRPRAVLDELLRLGVVELDRRDRVVLRAAAFIPSRGFDEKAFYLGHNVHDHLAAAAANLLAQSPQFLERSVHYDALDPASVPQLAALAEKAGMKALQAVNRRAMEREARDRARTVPKQRINFGTYFFSAPAAAGDRNDEGGKS